MTIPLFTLKVLGLSPRTVKERYATLYTAIIMIVATGSAIFITYLYIILPLGYTALSEVTYFIMIVGNSVEGHIKLPKCFFCK